MASIGVARLSSDAVATPPGRANCTAKERAVFPLIPPAGSSDGSVTLP
jgi:hypothetical protein